MVDLNYPVGAIEAGGTKFVCSYGVNWHDIVKNKITIQTSEDPNETIGKVVKWFYDQELKINNKINFLGLACFGPICLNDKSEKYGYITSTPKVNWNNYNIVGELKKYFPEINIGFDTDVNGAALGESYFGAAKNISNFVYITIGTGIGAGAIVNGKLLHGLMHPEMGHMRLNRIDSDNFPGSCQFHHDCWEGLCSGVAMMKRAGKSAELLPADHEAWIYEAEYTAQAIVNMIYVLSPQKIILGGSVSQGGQLGQKCFFEKIHLNVSRYLNGYIQLPEMELPDISNFIVSPGLGSDAGIVGAFLLGAMKNE